MSKPREIQAQVQIEIVKQHTNDIWDRVLFALELMEFYLDEIQEFPSWYDLDRVLGGIPAGDTRESAIAQFRSGDLSDLDLYVLVQIRSLLRCMSNKEANVIEDMQWLAEDYLRWIAGRGEKPWSRVDEYSSAILRCIDGYAYKRMLKLLPDPLEPETEIAPEAVWKAIEAFARAQHSVDKIEDDLNKKIASPDGFEAEQTRHERGDIEKGVARLMLGWCSRPEDLRWLQNTMLPKLGLENHSSVEGKPAESVPASPNDEIATHMLIHRDEQAASSGEAAQADSVSQHTVRHVDELDNDADRAE